VAGYTEGVPFEDILIPSWAAGFSAYGCACADLEYRFDKSVDYPLPPGASKDEKTVGAMLIDSVWTELRTRVAAEFAKSGFGEDAIHYRPHIRMQYLGQLNDLEFAAPVDSMQDQDGLGRCIEVFEELYGKVYALAAKSPELGYLFTTAVMAGSVKVEKPLLPQAAPSGPDPDEEALKNPRRLYWRGDWHQAAILEMGGLKSGNRIRGPAVIESPSTTLMIPPGREVVLDEHKIFHMNAARRDEG
jgi:N-methylhydantoinase A/oxoprolinase/acetone carboxylase beta subunit